MAEEELRRIVSSLAW